MTAIRMWSSLLILGASMHCILAFQSPSSSSLSSSSLPSLPSKLVQLVQSPLILHAKPPSKKNFFNFNSKPASNASKKVEEQPKPKAKSFNLFRLGSKTDASKKVTVEEEVTKSKPKTSNFFRFNSSNQSNESAAKESTAIPTEPEEIDQNTPIDFQNLSSLNFQNLTRRQLGQLTELTLATLGLTTSFLSTRETTPQEYGLWGILPVGPYKRKKTIMETVVPGQVWTFDQKFGILNVQVPLRMTVVKLSKDAGGGSGRSGGLFVYNPIAATPELLSLLQPLISQYGPIRHILLGSVAIEHKVYAGVFAQKFPGAKVWVTPGQYSFPENLPLPYLGFPGGRTKMVPMVPSPTDLPEEWNELENDLEIKTLGPLISRDGAFAETVVFHKPSRTLLVTDTVVEVSEDIPPIYTEDGEEGKKPLLYHARDTVTDRFEGLSEREVLEKGWRRVVLFGLFFTPGAIEIKDVNTALAERRPDINPDFLGVYPWDWVGDDIASFKALQGGLLVAPILQQLILNRNPIEVLDFADEVSKWPIQRIIPAHLKNNLKYTGKDYRAAFSFLEAKGVPKGLPKPLDIDAQALRDAEVNLLETGAVAKCPPLPGGNVPREEILRQTVYGCRADVCSPRSSA